MTKLGPTMLGQVDRLRKVSYQKCEFTTTQISENPTSLEK
jgi:hypothetical protein